MFAIGAIVPLIPYLLGFESLWAGLLCGGVGLIDCGGRRGAVHQAPALVGSLRQLAFGTVAIAATYLVGTPRRFDPLARMPRPMALVCCVVLAARNAAIADTTATVSAGPCSTWARCGWTGNDVDGTVVGGLSGLSYDPESQLLLHHQRRPLREEPCAILHRRIDPVQQQNRRGQVRCRPIPGWSERQTVPAAGRRCPSAGGAPGRRGHRRRQATPAALLVQRGGAADRRSQWRTVLLDPSVRIADLDGGYLGQFSLPSVLKMSAGQSGPRKNQGWRDSR